MAKGKVYIVGAGPARPDLITVRGLKILKSAEVIIYDYLVDKQLLKEASTGAELICADSLGKKKFANGFTQAQEKINKLIVRKALKGKKVVRLKNGDPSIFGRLSQELGTLVEHGIEYEIVPGVTAASAAAAYTGIPLTDRRFASSVAFVTGHEAPGKSKSLLDWESIASQGTIVLYMAVENLSSIVNKLISAGKHKDTPTVIVSRAGDVDQKYAQGKLDNIASRAGRAGIKPPAIVIIGEVAKLAEDYNWFEKSKRILFTGLSDERFFLPGNYFHLPLIEILPLKDYREFDKQLRNIEDFDWIVFSSRYGVRYFFERLTLLEFDARVLRGIKIAAIGSSTSNRLKKFNICADLVSKVESSKGLLKEFKKIVVKGEKIFMPRSDLADKGLKAGLEKLGAKVISAVAYRNVMPKNLPDISLNTFDEIYFTSPSTVRNFRERYGKVPKGVKVRWIGEVTRRELVRRGLGA